MRHFKAPDSIGFGIGKSAPHVAKQLTFKKGSGNTPQVYFDKRRFGAFAVEVDGFGNEFLTSTTFPRDQDGGVGWSHPANRFEQFQ